MMFMTAKVNMKKILIALVAVAAVVLLLILLLGGGSDDPSAPAVSTNSAMSSNESRVAFLESFGWKVSTSPVESGQVKIPKEENDVFRRYNQLQKSQGYDLSQFAGKTVLRYVYKVNNFPGATDPVYATILVYKDQVIGGDVTDTGAKGVIQGFQMASAPQPTAPEATVPQTDPTQPE